MDIFRFVRNGILCAKGFFNQEGLVFYVLPGSSEDLLHALEGAVVELKEVSSLPGEGVITYLDGTVAQLGRAVG